MATQEPAFETILDLVKRLTPGQKLQLIEAVIPDLEEPLRLAEEAPKPLRSLYGLWKNLNIEVSTEDIDEARRELWGQFPREDI